MKDYCPGRYCRSTRRTRVSEMDINVDINTRILWREPPKNHTEAMIRQQAEYKLQAVVAKFAEPIEEILRCLNPDG